MGGGGSGGHSGNHDRGLHPTLFEEHVLGFLKLESVSTLYWLCLSSLSLSPIVVGCFGVM